MSQVTRQWIANGAIDHTKVDPTDSTAFTFLRTNITRDSTVGTNLVVGGTLYGADATFPNGFQALKTVNLRDATLTSGLMVNGDATVIGHLGITGGIGVVNISIPGYLSVGGDSTVVGKSIVGGDFTVVGKSTAGSSLVSGDSTVSGTLKANKISVVQDVSITRDLVVSRDATVSGNLSISGGVAITNLILPGYLTVGGDTTMSGNLDVEKNIYGNVSNTSNLGTTSRRWANLYMASNIDYANDLIFTSSGEKVRIKTTGLVGIGTNNPGTPLHIYSPGTLDSIKIETSNAANATDVLFWNTGSHYGRVGMEGSTSGNIIAGSNPYAIVLTSQTNDLQFGSGANVRMTILSNGLVGIGITNPGSKFQVTNTTGNINSLVVAAPNIAGQSYGVEIDAGTNSSDICFRAMNSTGVTNYLLVRGDGNVGVGTASPVNPLDIGTAGGIHITSGIGNTTNALYNNSGVLYWNGGAVGTLTGSGTPPNPYYNVALWSGTSSLTFTGGILYNPGPFPSVGINQANPSTSYSLDVGGNIRASTAFTSTIEKINITNNTNTLDIGVNGQTPGAFAAGSYAYAAVINSVTAGYHLQFASNNTVRMTILSNGNVGIGSTNPLNALDVTGNISSTGTVSGNTGSFTNHSGTTMTGTLAMGTNAISNAGTLSAGSGGFLVDGSGRVGINTAVSFYSLDVYNSSTNIARFVGSGGSVNIIAGAVQATGNVSSTSGGLSCSGTCTGTGGLNAGAGGFLVNSTGCVGIGTAAGTASGRTLTIYRPLSSPGSPLATFYDDVGTSPHLSFNFTTGGNFTATGVKSFVQDHPTDKTKEIYYTCMEAGEVLVVLRGRAKTQNGSITINLPDHFGMVTSDKLPVMTQITIKNVPALLYVSEESREKITVKMRGADFSEFGDVEFNYFIQGIRVGYENSEIIRDKVSI